MRYVERGALVGFAIGKETPIGIEGDLDRQMPREGLYLLGLWPCSIQREAQAWPVQSVFGHLSEDGLASVVDDGFAVIV